jgi:3-phenylpropionate/trans-cinnamate dioxygenase ferredoxin reductase subunit
VNEHYDVLIVGAGHGGAQAAMALRQRGFEGTIGLIGAEPELPYDRPPLSKEYLSGDKPWERLVFRTAEAWAERGVDLMLGRRVTQVDANRRIVMTEAGDSIGYGTLIWAAGGSARALTCGGNDAFGVHSVRNRADVDRMMAELPEVREVVVIGGGYIGLEAAAVLRKFDKQVTVLEAMDRVLARVAAEPVSRFYEAEHRAHGVDVRLGIGVECIEVDAGRAAGVRLVDGSVLPAQMVIVGIGIDPDVAPLADAGATMGNGVRVDEHCRTSLNNIFAIGDCAEHRSNWAQGDWIRLESVQNANDQAMTAAKAICGAAEPYAAVPWFWSNQYDLRLQTVGLSRGYDDVVVRGDPASRSFSAVYLRCGSVIALDCINATRDYTHGRLLVAGGIQATREELADANIQLKTLI